MVLKCPRCKKKYFFEESKEKYSKNQNMHASPTGPKRTAHCSNHFSKQLVNRRLKQRALHIFEPTARRALNPRSIWSRVKQSHCPFQGLHHLRQQRRAKTFRKSMPAPSRRDGNVPRLPDSRACPSQRFRATTATSAIRERRFCCLFHTSLSWQYQKAQQEKDSKFRYDRSDYPINSGFALLEVSIHDSAQLFQVVDVWWIIFGEKRHDSLLAEILFGWIWTSNVGAVWDIIFLD